MSEQTRKVADRLYGAMSDHDPDAFAAVLADDVVNHGTQSQGAEQSRQELAYWLTAFPDLEIDVEHVICEGDQVAVRYIGRGTHRGDLGPIAPTGREVEVTQVDILRVDGGRVVEGWYLPDLYALFQQLGVIENAFAAPQGEAAAG